MTDQRLGDWPKMVGCHIRKRIEWLYWMIVFYMESSLVEVRGQSQKCYVNGGIVEGYSDTEREGTFGSISANVEAKGCRNFLA